MVIVLDVPEVSLHGENGPDDMFLKCRKILISLRDADWALSSQFAMFQCLLAEDKIKTKREYIRYS